MNDPLDTRVDQWMQQFAAIDDREHILPDPSVIWLKARVLQTAKAMERAARPITTMQMFAYGAVAACWAALLTWKWAAIQAWLDLRPSSLFLGHGSPVSAASIVTFLILGSATVLLAMHTIFLEE